VVRAMLTFYADRSEATRRNVMVAPRLHGRPNASEPRFMGPVVRWKSASTTPARNFLRVRGSILRDGAPVRRRMLRS
jgi:hypothetical protein